MTELGQPAKLSSEPIHRVSPGFTASCLPEMALLEQLISKQTKQLKVRTLAVIDHETDNQRHQLPIYSLRLGSDDPQAPVLASVGGVDGVERIGTRLLLTFLSSLLKRLQWDRGLNHELQHLRLLFCPLLNPAGMALGQRSNANGVDLMRNAPYNATDKATWMVGGHRLSNRLPWYRGAENTPMETEARVLCDWVRDELFDSPLSIVLDCHSGFGLRDRIWFPMAGSREPLQHRADIAALIHLFETSYPHHNYIIEPQHHSYLTHGDLWDYLYHQSLSLKDKVFLPLTLEMGSWSWVKKNPRQLISFMGLFNPLVPHREKRTMRRHLLLLEFLIRSSCAYETWLPDSPMSRLRYELEAKQRWYG